MKPKQTTVIFDCERMRYPNTGLYVFGKELIMALQKESFLRKKRLMVYARKQTVNDWGIRIERRRIFKLIDKRFLIAPRGVGLWHSPFQLSFFFPKNTKILLTIHDLNFLYESDKDIQAKELHKLQKIVDKSTRIVAISQFVKDDILKHLDVKGKTVSVIYNGCSLYKGELQSPSVKPQRKFLFSVGTVLPKKNFHVLPCLLQGNDYELIIAGVRSNYENEIKKEAQKYGVADRVRIIGAISEEEKHWYYKNCEAFLFPSIAEGFGLPVIEAMYYQRPIFLSRHTSLPEIGGQYAFYFNREFNREQMQEEFKKGMDIFSSGGINREAMRQHALSFSWENAAKQYWDIYEQLLESV